ncbi:MAG: class I SAM-dependent methyltransferase [Pirellulaceae bacterium]
MPLAQELSTEEAAIAWLVSPAATPYLTQYDAQTINSPQVVERLRAEIGPLATRLVARQLEQRGRGGVKFSQAASMFFTSIGLQQASDEVIAGYKAARFPQEKPLADLCCGIGGDLIALAQRGPTLAVDLSTEHLAYAEANCRVYGVMPSACLAIPAESTDLTEVAAWHIDPDRRATESRTTNLEQCSPPLADLRRLIGQNPNACLKLAPATSLPDDWHDQVECEWISHLRECKQLVAWSGTLATDPGMHRATKLQGAEISTFVGRPNRPLIAITDVGRFIHDPDPSIVAARLVDDFAEQQTWTRLSATSQYLTSDQCQSHGLIQSFEVLVSLPLDRKAIQQVLRSSEVGTLEIKKRGLDIDLPALRKKLKLAGPNERTLILSPTAAGNRAYICRRVG